jgi:hypothetical protein
MNPLLPLFFVSLTMPIYFFVGELRLTPMRVLLILYFAPLVMKLLRGRAGGIRSIDVFLVLFCVWLAVTLLYHEGMSRLGLVCISIIELFGGYLVGRTMVRSSADFRMFFRCFLFVLIFLLPFAVIELFTNRNFIQDFYRSFIPTLYKGNSSYGRMGLFRVMSSFEHPILYGIFCSVGFAPIFYIFREKLIKGLTLVCFVLFMTFMSLSSGPLLAIAVQFGLMVWDKITGGRWWTLAIILTVTYIVVDLLSNRTPITILISYITFSPATAWARVYIWNFGSAEVWRHPLMGIGLGDWIRPYWLTGSVDNFWLVQAMRHGLPGIGFLVVGLGFGFRAIVRARGLSREDSRYRTGYLVALAAMYFALTTVHAWGTASSFVMCFIGAGMWFCDAGRSVAETASVSDHTRLPRAGSSLKRSVPSPSVSPARPLRYSRFQHQISSVKKPADESPSYDEVGDPH